ncbi:MAG: N5-glutamine methyltransferase family protein [Acidobacteriota bacterium]
MARAGELWRDALDRLRRAGVPNPSRDALLLLADAFGAEKAQVLAHPEWDLPEEGALRLEEALRRRVAREPLQYIRGFQPFWTFRVAVGPGCLIPRPETEHLLEAALDHLRPRRRPRAAEAGTGSGALLRALAQERPDGRFTGLEREGQALAWSRRNLEGLANVLLVQGDLERAPLAPGLHLLLANPPYVTDSEWDSLPPEVRLYEPSAALRCGPDPLAPYRALGRTAAETLVRGGILACEVGVAQARRAPALRRIHRKLEWLEGRRDLSGRLRVAVWARA